jgi:RNA polymerase sigma-70 factor (ECF subfamily)
MAARSHHLRLIMQSSGFSTRPKRVAFPANSDPREQACFLEALQRKDPDAHAELFRRHYQRVISVLQRVLGSDTELKDLAQEVFLQALKGIESFRGAPNQVEAWLLGIAVLRARERIRRRQVSRRYIVAVAEPPDVESGSTPKMEHIDALRRTYAALDRMAVELRVALVLRDVERMSLEEIADVCGISLSTAKRRVRRGRERFERLAALDPVLCDLMRANGGTHD